ncbi:hypothetical protein EYF80_027297 [Liparis tanakae]|uniref:Uncharacterized protein n=1 Tax=Liparis tanakae TaxID=230148 RepID=A0A4Z2HC69_9TELE|nr:hypothetical protein EYF80_027297 [Liparis tanakae]
MAGHKFPSPSPSAVVTNRTEDHQQDPCSRGAGSAINQFHRVSRAFILNGCTFDGRKVRPGTAPFWQQREVEQWAL